MTRGLAKVRPCHTVCYQFVMLTTRRDETRLVVLQPSDENRRSAINIVTLWCGQLWHSLANRLIRHLGLAMITPTRSS